MFFLLRILSHQSRPWVVSRYTVPVRLQEPTLLEGIVLRSLVHFRHSLCELFGGWRLFTMTYGNNYNGMQFILFKGLTFCQQKPTILVDRNLEPVRKRVLLCDMLQSSIGPTLTEMISPPNMKSPYTKASSCCKRVWDTSKPFL